MRKFGTASTFGVGARVTRWIFRSCFSTSVRDSGLIHTPRHRLAHLRSAF
jgi:hypothetical protein